MSSSGSSSRSSSSSSPTSSLWVRLDLTSDQATAETGSLRLHATNGPYDQKKPISGNFSVNPDDGTVDVEFDNVPRNANYSLSYIGSDGDETVLVQSAAFEMLKDNLKPEAPGESGGSGPGPTPAPAPGE